MKNRINKAKPFKAGYTALAGGILGMVIFIIVYGIYVVNPCYDDWIWNSNGDITQHYIGWLFLRRSDWHFPLGLIDGLIADTSVSCVYTDSIPALAIFFKILSPILPDTFQYLGLWGFFCFGMQGALSSLILRRFSKNPVYCLAGSVFFILSPVVIFRMFTHTSLAGHWIILLALLIWVYQDRQWKYSFTPVILWTLNGMAAAMVHIYFIPMIYMIMGGYIITDLLKNKKLVRPLLCFASTTFFSLITLFCIGAFYGSTEASNDGLCAYSANFNSLFNGMGYSKFLAPLNLFSQGQTEGFGYLGLGMIVAAAMAVVIFVYNFCGQGGFSAGIKAFLRSHWQTVLAVALVIAVSLFLAASPLGTLNAGILYNIKYPEKFIKLLSIFRASGRFIWVTDYLIFTIVLAAFAKIDRPKAMIFAVMLCLSVQLLDLRDFAADKHKNFACRTEYISPLKDSFWNDEAIKSKSKIVFLQISEDFSNEMNLYFNIAGYAIKNDMELSSFYLARCDFDKLKNYADEQLSLLEQGKGNSDTLYIFLGDYKITGNEKFNVRKADKITVATSSRSPS